MSTAVVLAEKQLNTARAEEARHKREDAREQIRAMRREGAALLRRYRPLAAQVKKAEQERLKLNGLLVQARERIAFYSEPLDPETFPTDEQMAAHAEQLELWKAQQQELLAQSADATRRESVRLDAVAIQNRLQYLQHSLRNLTEIAEGRMPGEIEGGVFMGVEDFIGHTDRRFS